VIENDDRASGSADRRFLDNYDAVIERFVGFRNLKVDVSFAELSLTTLDKVGETAGIALDPYPQHRAWRRRRRALRYRRKAVNNCK